MRNVSGIGGRTPPRSGPCEYEDYHPHGDASVYDATIHLNENPDAPIDDSLWSGVQSHLTRCI